MRELHVHEDRRDPVVIALMAGVLVLLVIALLALWGVWLRLGYVDQKLRDVDKRAPCEGCFDSLKWRVDIHHPVRPGDPYEQTYGGDPIEEEALQSPGATVRGDGGGGDP